MCGDNQYHHPRVPRGCVAVLVGEKEKRFVIPITYLNHPRFMILLKEAEEVYGFRHKGNIALPCDVDEFVIVGGLIEQEIRSTTCAPRHHQYRQPSPPPVSQPLLS
ncbi:hypothetical protein MKW98_008125 [Papaver atlanticum]|uniref:Small auxin up regulated protein n=1 Tax=Papaver atlanticum TaxID=357466 RepID=A0AAD4S7N6_9MAGN|nr:hypothetical protein MKW98_008125 [Papaver atlanticum]